MKPVNNEIFERLKRPKEQATTDVLLIHNKIIE